MSGSRSVFSLSVCSQRACVSSSISGVSLDMLSVTLGSAEAYSDWFRGNIIGGILSVGVLSDKSGMVGASGNDSSGAVASGKVPSWTIDPSVAIEGAPGKVLVPPDPPALAKAPACSRNLPAVRCWLG